MICTPGCITDNISQLENRRVPQEKSSLFLLHPSRNGIRCANYCSLGQSLGHGNVHFEGLSDLHDDVMCEGTPQQIEILIIPNP
jgi:hypothetical protein